MGTHAFFKNKAIQPSGLSMESRAIGAGSYGARSAGQGAQKDVAAALAAGQHGLKNPTRDAAVAPGPKRT